MSTTPIDRADLKRLGQIVQSKTIHAVSRLREKYPASIKSRELIDYIFSQGEQQLNSQAVRHLKLHLSSPKTASVSFNGIDDTYRFKPPYEISSAEQLTAYFQRSDASSIDVKKLKEGWSTCDETINILEKEHKLIVQRNRKDNTPRYIWPDDPSLHLPAMDEEFVKIWAEIPLPEKKDDVIKELVKNGYTPTGDVAAPLKVEKVEKKRKVRAGLKTTNKHMTGLLKDYSGMRPKGK